MNKIFFYCLFYFRIVRQLRFCTIYYDRSTLYKKDYQNKARNRQLRACLKKYRDVCANKEELQKEMKKNFGVDVVFFGKKDKPYGYMLIDHANKTVIHGARVLAVEELLDFATPEQRFDRIEAYIGQLLQLNPKITQGEIFQKLKKQHAYIKKGFIYYDGQSRPLPEEMAAAINRNNRISFIEKFRPQNEAEVELLRKAFKVDRPDMVSISTERPPKYADSVGRLHEIFNDPEVKSSRSAMYQEGFIIRQVDNPRSRSARECRSKSPRRRRSIRSRVCSGSLIKDWANSGKKVSAATAPTANGKSARRRTTMRWIMDTH